MLIYIRLTSLGYRTITTRLNVAFFSLRQVSEHDQLCEGDTTAAYKLYAPPVCSWAYQSSLANSSKPRQNSRNLFLAQRMLQQLRMLDAPLHCDC